MKALSDVGSGGQQTLIGRAVASREAAKMADITAHPDYPLREVMERASFKALLAVPLLRDNEAVGALVVRRKTPGTFDRNTVELLQTMGTQSALAIYNARLFNEIQEKSRQLEMAYKHKSEFLANMSHELRTPLNAVIGFSEVLLEKMFGELNEKREDYLKDIHSSGQHLLSLINDILDLAKVEAGRMELSICNVDLPTAIDNALTLIRERAARHGISLTAQVDPQLREMNADERKLKQILLNLLSNAVKFTPEGGKIKVGASQIDARSKLRLATRVSVLQRRIRPPCSRNSTKTAGCSGYDDGKIEGENGVYTAYPGNYGPGFNLDSIVDVNPSGTLYLIKGIYCFYDGLRLNSTWTIKTDSKKNGEHDSASEGVFFFVPGGDITFNGSSFIEIYAVDSTAGGFPAQFVDTLIYVPPPNPNDIYITGSNGSTYTGTILAPRSYIRLNGGTDTVGLNSQIIGYAVAIEGNGLLNINYDADDNAVTTYNPSLAGIE